MDLTGLSNPIFVSFDIGDYSGMAETQKQDNVRPLPMKLLNGALNSIRADQAYIKASRRQHLPDFLIIRGGVSAENTEVDLSDKDVVFKWALQTFTVPAGGFKKVGQSYNCQNVAAPEGASVTAAVNFPAGTFNLSVTDTTIDAKNGEVTFKITFDGFDAALELSSD